MITFEHWGEIEYFLALQKQSHIVKHLQQFSSRQNERIIFCSHNPVVTLGKQVKKESFIKWKGPIFSIKRGGAATYHGPSQVIIYLMLDLQKRNNDIFKLLRILENSLINTLVTFHLKAKGFPLPTGVWINDKKIASIGMAVSRGITCHGMAVNLYSDPCAFYGISPCGLPSTSMTSIEETIDRKIDRKKFEKLLLQNIQEKLARNFSFVFN